MTIAAIVVGMLVVALAAYSQLSGRVTDTLTDPGIAYPASIQHDNELGSATAPVTLEVYGDFQCPHCASSSLDTEPSIVSTYVIPGKVRIVHHDFVWVSQNADRESRVAAAGAICAQRQGRYWDYAHWVYANQLGENVGSYTGDRLTRIAAAAGLDATALGACIGAPDVLAQVDANTAAFTPVVEAHGGTPMFFLNGEFAVAGYLSPAALGTYIDAALAGGSAAPASGSPGPSASATP
jgi:protein-disulfide isomerase